MEENMALISCTEKSVEMVLKDYGEWLKFWWDSCRPWKDIDVSGSMKVWRRWVGVPLQAWNGSFFQLRSSKFGNFIMMHDQTKLKLRLDEALILVSTDMALIHRVISCQINGANFQIRIDEILCGDRVDKLIQADNPRLKEGVDSDEFIDRSDDDLVDAVMWSSLEACSGKEKSVIENGEAEESNGNARTEDQSVQTACALEKQKDSAVNDVCLDCQDSVGTQMGGGCRDPLEGRPDGGFGQTDGTDWWIV